MCEDIHKHPPLGHYPRDVIRPQEIAKHHPPLHIPSGVGWGGMGDISLVTHNLHRFSGSGPGGRRGGSPLSPPLDPPLPMELIHGPGIRREVAALKDPHPIGPVSQKYRILRYEKTRVFYD